MAENVTALKSKARLAGFLYLIWVITGIYGLVYVHSHTIVPGDPAATANKMLANEFLFRTGLLNDLISTTVCVFLLITLYQLFKQVHESQAKYMFALFFVTLPANFIMIGFSIASLMIFKGEILGTFELSQKQDIAMMFLKINSYVSIALEMFWGLWLIPFGILVWKSGFIARILGVFLMLNGVAYIIPSFISLVFPQYEAVAKQVGMPFWILGEISITLWLLIKGVRNIPRNSFSPLGYRHNV